MHGGLAKNSTVLDGPVQRVAIPAGEILAVEDGDEARLDTAFWNDLFPSEGPYRAQQANCCCQDYTSLPNFVSHLLSLSKFTITGALSWYKT